MLPFIRNYFPIGKYAFGDVSLDFPEKRKRGGILDKAASCPLA
jgi:hypothetical protein